MSQSTTLPGSFPAEANYRLKNLPTYVFAWLDDLKARARARGAELIDLGMGNPDQPTPEPVIQAIQQAYAEVGNHGYPPFKGTDRFRKTVSCWMNGRFGIELDPETEILCLSGSKEGLAHLSFAYIGEGDYSLVPEIYYPVLSRATWLSGGQVYHLPMKAENNFLPDLDNIPAEVLLKSKLFFVNYPNNPTGAAANLAFYEKAVAFCKQHNLILVSDLAYSEIGFDGYRAPSALEVPGAKDVTVEFHSFSKSFNMAGSRLGFAVGNPEIIRQLYALRTNVGYGTPTPIQEGGIAALAQCEQYIGQTVANYQERRDVVVEGFRALGWPIEPPKATLYVWLKVPQGFTSEAWTEHLIDTAGVVVSPGHAFGKGGEGYFRVSLVTPRENLLKAFERLQKHGIRFA